MLLASLGGLLAACAGKSADQRFAAAPDAGSLPFGSVADGSVPSVRYDLSPALDWGNSTGHSEAGLGASSLLIATLDGDQVLLQGASACTEGNARNLSGHMNAGAWTGWMRLEDDPNWRGSGSLRSFSLRGSEGTRLWQLVWRDTCASHGAMPVLWLDCADSGCVVFKPPLHESAALSDPTQASGQLRATLQQSTLVLSGASFCTQGLSFSYAAPPESAWYGWKRIKDDPAWNQGASAWSFDLGFAANSGRWDLFWVDPCSGASEMLVADCSDGPCVTP